MATLAAFLISSSPVLAQSTGSGKEKGGVLQVNFVGTYSVGGDAEAVILGPLPADVSLDVFTITSVNTQAAPMSIRYRAIQPANEPVEPEDCTAGAATVIGELAGVVVPPLDSSHQEYPEGTEVPGTYFNSVGLIGEASAPWCLIAFVSSPYFSGAAFTGTVTFRFNQTE
jgi:hypothetical protein